MKNKEEVCKRYRIVEVCINLMGTGKKITFPTSGVLEEFSDCITIAPVGKSRLLFSNNDNNYRISYADCDNAYEKIKRYHKPDENHFCINFLNKNDYPDGCITLMVEPCSFPESAIPTNSE